MAARAYRILRQEKVNLAKWEVQGDPVLLLLDDFHLLPPAAREEVLAVVQGSSLPHCSVLATSSLGCGDRESFQVQAQLRGWREAAVVEVIHRQFPHSPNKVLALKLKLSGAERSLALVGSCPLLTSLLCLAYEDTGELEGSASETLHTIMRCVFKRELFRAGRVLHDSNYESSLAVLGQRCLGALCKGRAFLTEQEVEGLTRRYCSTVMGCLVQPCQQTSPSRPSSWLPLHPAFLHFAAGFYLKSLSEARDLERLGDEVERVVASRQCPGTSEPVLTAALEMLAPANAGSDLLARLPEEEELCVAREEVLEVQGEAVTVSRQRGTWVPLSQGTRLRLLRTAGPGPAALAAVLAGLGGKVAKVLCREEEVEGWTRLLDGRGRRFPEVEVTWDSSCASLADLPVVRLLQVAQQEGLDRLLLRMDLKQPLGIGLEAGEQIRQVRL